MLSSSKFCALLCNACNHLAKGFSLLMSFSVLLRPVVSARSSQRKLWLLIWERGDRLAVGWTSGHPATCDIQKGMPSEL